MKRRLLTFIVLLTCSPYQALADEQFACFSREAETRQQSIKLSIAGDTFSWGDSEYLTSERDPSWGAECDLLWLKRVDPPLGPGIMTQCWTSLDRTFTSAIFKFKFPSDTMWMTYDCTPVD